MINQGVFLHACEIKSRCGRPGYEVMATIQLVTRLPFNLVPCTLSKLPTHPQFHNPTHCGPITCWMVPKHGTHSRPITSQICSPLQANSQSKSAKTQLQMMTKEKGVAMRDNAASYQQSIQRESQLRELQAEKEILEQQRDIANKERERVIGEAVALKKKLETIKTQRQRDAKDLR